MSDFQVAEQGRMDKAEQSIFAALVARFGASAVLEELRLFDFAHLN